MKKVIFFLILAFVLMGVIPAMAENELGDYKQIIVNNTAEKVATLIPTTLIIPGKCRILKVTCATLASAGGGTENVIALNDASSVGAMTDKNSEGETESNDSDDAVLSYVNSLRISNGCVITQGAFTVVLVEWERVIP